MNAKILKLNPTFLLNGGGNDCNSLTMENSGKKFSSIIKGLLSAIQEKIVPAEGHQASPSLKAGGNQYIESLKTALAAHGVTLQEASLDSENFYLLKTFLQQCGLTITQAERLVEDMANNNPEGKINLEAFFETVSGSDLLGEQARKPMAVESSSIIAAIETGLRDCGLSQRHIDNALAFAKTEDGKIDLSTLIQGLQKQANDAPEAVNRPKLHQVIASIEELVSQPASSHSSDNNEVSSKIIDMIGSTGSQSDYGHDKKATAVPDLKYSLSPEVQATIENIATATKTAGESRKPLTFPSKDRDLEALLSSKGTTGETKDNAKGHEVKVTASDNNKFTPTSMKYNGEMVKEFDAKSQAAVTSEPDGQTGLKRNLKESGGAEKSSIKPVPIPNNTSASIPAEQINSPEKGQNTVKTGLPDYVINQVGRQIRKSIQDGKSFIKLQLKPPELGSIKIELRIEDNSLRLKMITQDNSVKHILLSNLNELKESLLDQGIKPDKIDIQIDYKPDQSLDNPNKHSGKHGEGEKVSHYTTDPFNRKGEITGGGLSEGAYNAVPENHLLNLMA